MTETYIFTVVLSGPDVQGQADRLREQIIDLSQDEDFDEAVLHVTESVRVGP